MENGDRMNIEFMKMHGAGNDFVVIDDRNGETAKKIPYPDLAKRLCSRHFGIGADGILLILNSETHDIRFRIFNSDGSEAGMCGNGIRCFASYLVAQNIVETTTIRVETPAGTVVPEVLESGEKRTRLVRVDMGEPVFDPGAIPFVCHTPRALDQVIVADGREVAVTAVAMGNPNAVVFVDDVEIVDLVNQGRAIETHDRFPEKANVVFIQVVDRNEVKMRVWERGAGETLACGTGACAAVAAGCITGRTDNRVLVHLAGGDLDILWERKSNHVFKTGPAVSVFTGRVHL